VNPLMHTLLESTLAHDIEVCQDREIRVVRKNRFTYGCCSGGPLIISTSLLTTEALSLMIRLFVSA